jgi:hypothetical protein
MDVVGHVADDSVEGVRAAACHRAVALRLDARIDGRVDGGVIRERDV